MSTKQNNPKRLGWLKHREGKAGHKYLICPHSKQIVGCKNRRCETNQLTVDHKYQS